MPIGTIPPWLNIQPQQFVEAARSGTAAGVSIAAAQQRAQEAAAEQARAAAAADARRWEFEQDLQRRAIEQSAARQQAAAQLAASERYNLARLAQGRSSNEAQAAHWQAIENAANARAGQSVMPTEFNRDPNKAYVTAGGSFIPPVKPNIPRLASPEDTAYWAEVRKLELENKLAPSAKDEQIFRLGVLRDAQKKERMGLPAIPQKPGPRLDTFGTPYPPANPTNATNLSNLETKVLTKEKGKEFYSRAGGDIEKARQLAREEGYTL